MRLAKVTVLAASAAFGVALLASSADAAPRRHARVHDAFAGRSITVNKRAFTDRGNVVPVGSESRYVSVGANYGRQNPGVTCCRYGSETLPGRFENPGAGPLFNF
jgi:hypothetical protein